MTELKEWLGQMANERLRLYEQYGRPLEVQHTGEYVAIGFNGQTILAKRSGEALKEALDTFGSGNFVLARVGHRTFGRWLNLNK